MIKGLLRSSWNFVKAQSAVLGSWAFLSVMAGLCMLGLFFAEVLIFLTFFMFWKFLVLIFPFPALLCVLFVVLGAMALVFVLRKFIGYLNVLAINALDAAHGRPLRRFENRVGNMTTLYVGCAYFMLISVGSLFLIIPGIIFAVRFSLAYWVMLEEGTGVRQSLMRSWDLTRGCFLSVAVLLLVVALESLIPFLNIIFPVPFFCMANLYVQLHQRKLTVGAN